MEMISFAFCGGISGGEANRGYNSASDRVVGRAGLDCSSSKTTVIFGKTGLVFNGDSRDRHFVYVANCFSAEVGGWNRENWRVRQKLQNPLRKLGERRKRRYSGRRGR